jgi:hypothetical protein
MFYSRFKPFILIISFLLSISLISLAACASTAVTTPQFTAPMAPLPPPPLPIEVTIGQLSSEYALDEAAADAKYKGKKLLFNQLEVEEVVFQQFWGLVGDDKPFKIYFKNGNVSFIPQDQSILRSIMQSIETGFILNVEGVCLGLIESRNSITIDVYRMETIKGDIGPG